MRKRWGYYAKGAICLLAALFVLSVSKLDARAGGLPFVGGQGERSFFGGTGSRGNGDGRKSGLFQPALSGGRDAWREDVPYRPQGYLTSPASELAESSRELSIWKELIQYSVADSLGNFLGDLEDVAYSTGGGLILTTVFLAPNTGYTGQIYGGYGYYKDLTSPNPYHKSAPEMEIFTNTISGFGWGVGWLPGPGGQGTSYVTGILNILLRDERTVATYVKIRNESPIGGALHWMGDQAIYLNAAVMDTVCPNGSSQDYLDQMYDLTEDKNEAEDAKYWARLKKYADMVNDGEEDTPEGRELRDWLLDEQDKRKNKKRDQGTPKGLEAKKPNIYLYPERETEVEVLFDRPELLIVSDPFYGEGWRVTARPDGTLIDDSGAEYGYLFYESRTDRSCFRTEEGFLVKAESRASVYRDVLARYGLNDREIEDFVEYWETYLEAGVDYVMYPLLTEGVDWAMPVAFYSGGEPLKPDSVLRLWFGFERWDGSEVKEPETAPLKREGFTVVEWGGAVFD